MALDLKLFYFFNHLAYHSGIFDQLIIFLASYGEFVLGAVFILLLYFSGYSRRDKIYIFGVAMVSAAIARFGITELIRFWYHRPRPFIALPIQHLLTDNDWSFPSGHAARLFALSMAVYLCQKRWGFWFFLASAAIVISRVIAGIHYPSDILGGLIIGLLTAYLIFYGAEKKKVKPPPKKY